MCAAYHCTIWLKAHTGKRLSKANIRFFALNIELPPTDVDVNVHPNKMQVRFKDAAAVEHVIKEAVSKACDNIRGSIAFEKSEKIDKKRIEMQHTPEMTQTELFTGFKRSALKEDENINMPGTGHPILPVIPESPREAVPEPLDDIADKGAANYRVHRVIS